MNIDTKEVEYIASLARLSITDDEKERIGSQLNNILGYIEKLKELDTSGVPPTSHVLDLANIMRNDTSQDCLSVDEVLSNAPDRSGSFYRVPKIIE